MSRRDGPVAFHPLLLAAFPVLFLWSRNAAEVMTGQVLPLLGMALAGGAGAYALAALVLRRQHRAALVASALLVLFFSYGHVWQLAGGEGAAHGWLLTVWGVLAAGAVAAALRAARRILAPLTRGLNTAAAILVALSLPPVVAAAAGEDPVTLPDPLATGADAGPAATAPDIYYIIVDRYGRADTLAEQFGHDNRPFTSFLEEAGFVVAHRSLASYPKTAHSLASSLNLTHLDGLAAQVGYESADWRPIYRLLDRHRVGTFLTARGYRYEHLGSWWEPTARSSLADVNHTYDPSSEFASVLARTTLLAATPLPAGGGFRELSRGTTLFQLDRLERLAARRDSQPTFVLAHLTIPHEPYVFEPDGSEPDPATVAARSYEENYLAQLGYINRRLRDLVRRLLSGPADTAPVVVIQSDEGPHPARLRADGDAFVWTEATQRELESKLRIFNAYYLPGVAPERIPPTITPVNTFRLIFDAYFDAGLGMLEDRTFVYHGQSRPYDFTEVTYRLRP